jgi:prevent-host-death family protein
MREVGAYEAKTHLPRLLEQVEKGESFVITRHGRPVAELVPISGQDATAVRSAIEDLAALRAELAARGVGMRDLLAPGQSVGELAHEGHRY